MTRGDRAVSVVLHEVATHHNRRLDGSPENHREQPSTQLEPALVVGEGSVIALVGYDIAGLNELGDTLVTYGLLIELSPAGGETLRAIWYEDRMEVPHTLAMGAGPVRLGQRNGIIHFDLELTDADYGDEVKVSGTLGRQKA